MVQLRRDMIVGEYFPDDDLTIGWLQHDVYGQALGIIVNKCNHYTRFAKAVLEPEGYSSWGTVGTFDHRTLQEAHDLLAAAWRFQHIQGQIQKTIFDDPKEDVQTLWLHWLQDEVAQWIHQPQIVRDVQLILENQNKPLGYQAESRLRSAILERFFDVSWRIDIDEQS